MATRIGQYEIQGRFAVGGMAEIHYGRAVGEEGFEKPVVIKRVLPDFARDARFVSMLITEARIHAALSHKNIVQIHDLGLSEAGEYFIVLEYVDGRDLGSLLEVLSRTRAARGGRLRIDDAVALHIIIEVAEGVHCAHELCGEDGNPLGLVHRDISPSNVLLSYAGEVKLSDFGLAKRRTDHSVVGSLKGKLAYMSPEQARRQPLDRRSDIFSLGAVLYEMLTGHRLRELADEVQGWQEVASGLVPSPSRDRPGLLPALERILSGALAPQPRDRFADAQAFVTAAREALDIVPRAAQSEAAQLAELLHALFPLGSARPETEPSKVIRFVTQFLPPHRTMLLPGIPPQFIRPLAPEPVPPPRRRPTPPGLPPLPPRRSTPLGSPAWRGSARRPSTVEIEIQRSSRRFRWLGVGVLLALPVVTATVHWAFVPLPVLRAWWRPTRFEVVSQPPGAAVLLDGRRLAVTTPLSVMVRRDRRTHMVEVRKEGLLPTRRPMRFDRSEILFLSVVLRPESRPSYRPIPSPGSVISAPDTGSLLRAGSPEGPPEPSASGDARPAAADGPPP